jgi:hypothetical protein
MNCKLCLELTARSSAYQFVARVPDEFAAEPLSISAWSKSEVRPLCFLRSFMRTLCHCVRLLCVCGSAFRRCDSKAAQTGSGGYFVSVEAVDIGTRSVFDG